MCTEVCIEECLPLPFVAAIICSCWSQVTVKQEVLVTFVCNSVVMFLGMEEI
jgi:hypothetical protein